MTSPTVQFDFGDGTKVDGTNQGGGTWTADHTYDAPGDYTITAKAGSAEGSADYTVPDDDGDSGPAQPTLSVGQVDLQAGDSDVEQSSTLKNSKGHSDHCLGSIRITDGAVLDGKVTEVMVGFWGPGDDTDLTVEWAVDGDDLVGSYGGPDGFPVAKGLDGATTNKWSVAADAAPGDYNVSTAILDKDLPPQDTVLTSAGWHLVITAAEPSYPAQLTSVTPNSAALAQDDGTFNGTAAWTGSGAEGIVIEKADDSNKAVSTTITPTTPGNSTFTLAGSPTETPAGEYIAYLAKNMMSSQDQVSNTVPFTVTTS